MSINKLRALCIAERFQFDTLYESLTCQMHAARMRNVIILTPDDGVYAFIFDYGVCVLYRYDYESEKRLVDLLLKYAVNPLDPFIEEELDYQKSSEDGLRIRNDLIEVDDVTELACLSLAHALAQSTKLAVFETSIEETIKKTKYIPVTLARKGAISLSRTKLAKERGRVYLEKSHVILQFNLLDTPEFIWEYPELEHYYLALSRYLEITPRATVLKNRLEVIQELLEMMADEQKHSHSSMLEWIIIILIAIEIGLFFFK
ncbi:MAG: RMD1 family protein [Desulfobulbaceae bacterium]|nr:RMD1 family protein [Desulfobulbaceae bacterium]